MTPTVGKYAARATLICARATTYWAAAALSVSLETSTFFSNASSAASPKSVHQSPRSAASLGWACFHVTADGAASLKTVVGAAAAGRR